MEEMNYYLLYSHFWLLKNIKQTVGINMFKKSRNYISLKYLVYITVFLYLTMICVTTVILYFFITKIDNLESSEVQKRLALGVANEVRLDKILLEEYVFWDISYEKVFVEKDQKWVDENIGMYLIKRYNFDFSLAINAQNDLEFFDANQAIDTKLLDSFKVNKFNELRELSASNNDKLKAVHSYFELNNKLYYVLGGPFVDEETEKPHKGTFLLLGKEITKERLHLLSQRYHLPEIKMTEQKFGDEFKALHSPKGLVLGYLSAIYPHDNYKLILYISISYIIFFMLTISIINFIVKLENSDRSKYEEKVYKEATTDPLTTLYNRRHFNFYSRKLFNNSIRHEKYLSMLMLDIDHFKFFNDTYGHSCGDIVLKDFANACSKQLRDFDLFCRYGGEEFIILLPDTNTDVAYSVAEKLRKTVEMLTCSHKNKSLSINVSIGVTSLNTNSCVNDMIEEADKALYRAKENGRNRTEVFSE